MGNRVYLSPYQVGHIEGLEKAMSFMSEMFLGRPSGIEAVFYASLFQTGVSKLVVPQSVLKEVPSSDFVQGRTEAIDPQISDHDYKVVKSIFSQYLPEDYFRHEKYSDVWTLEVLLSDLCVGLRQNIGILFPGPIPQKESLRGILPPELLVPAYNLIDAIQESSASGPFPRYEVQKTDIELYQDILNSNLFIEFCDAHEPLAYQNLSVEKCLPKIHRLAVAVQDKYLDHLKISKIALSLLPIVPRVVDKIFGAFPGVLAEHLTTITKPILENRRRLVLYDTSKLSTELMSSTMLYVAKNRDEEPIVKRRLEKHKNRKAD